MYSMTSAQRMRALIAGEKIDRVPVFGFAYGYAARLCGISLYEFWTDIDKCIESQLLAADLHGYDSGPDYGWADWGGWEFGAGIEFPANSRISAPRTVSELVTRVEDIELLSIPDPATAGMFPKLMEFNRRMRRMGFPAKVPMGSPTNLASAIIGKERLLRWYLREPEAVRAVYGKVTDFILKAADMIIAEFGSENCSAGYGAPLDSNYLISLDTFASFVMPYLERIHYGLMDRGITRFGMHICGNHRRNLELWANLPLPPRCIISVGSEMDLAQVAEAFGHRHIIAGNVPTTLLNRGSYEQVYKASCECIEKGKKLPGGFVLMPACDLPVGTPPINVHAMVKASREFGRYE